MTIWKFVATLLVTGTAVLLCGPPGIASAQRAKPLAKVGAQELTPAEVKALLSVQPEEVRQQLLANPKQLEELVKVEAERKAVLLEARRTGFDKRAEIVTLLQRAKEQTLLGAYLAPQTSVPKDYPSDDVVAAYYEANKDRFLSPEQVNVSTIFLLVLPAWAQDRALEEKVQAEMLHLAGEARKGGDFAELARLHSQDRPTAENGGAVGWVTAAQLLPELAQVAFKLKPGEISQPIRAHIGYHVLRVNDRKPAVQRSLTEVRRVIVQLLQNEYRAKKEREAIDRAVKAHPVTMDAAAIEKWRSDEVAAAAKK